MCSIDSWSECATICLVLCMFSAVFQQLWRYIILPGWSVLIRRVIAVATFQVPQPTASRIAGYLKKDKTLAAYSLIFTLCTLGNLLCFCWSSCWFFFSKLTFLNNSFRTKFRVSNDSDPDQDRHSLGPSRLQWFSADEKKSPQAWASEHDNLFSGLATWWGLNQSAQLHKLGIVLQLETLCSPETHPIGGNLKR